jgi:hypothetical protein
LRPGSGYQLLLGDHLAGPSDQSGQDVEGAATQPHRFVPFKQKPLRCMQPERAKGDCESVHR